MNAKPITRRALVTAGGTAAIGAGTLVLAACSSDASSDAGSGAEKKPSTPKTTAGTVVAKLADIPVGGTLAAKLEGKPVLLAQPTAGKVTCFSAICTHQGCVVKAAAKEFDCPCHGSKFSTDGAVLNGPAVNPLNKVDVTVSGDTVVTA